MDNGQRSGIELKQMVKSYNNAYTLAIEAAIAGGSLSLCRGETEIAGWSGSADVSKAEDLLYNIDILLRENGVSKHDLGLIAVSAGPGSFTGIRIGIATALGLKNGLGIPMSSVSALNAMVAYPELDGTAWAAVPSGRNAVCMQEFTVENGSISEIGEPQTIREDDFFATVYETPVLAHGALCKRGSNEKFIDVGTGIALFIAKYCSENPNTATPPLFISKSF